jgi:hypothetical protein
LTSELRILIWLAIWVIGLTLSIVLLYQDWLDYSAVRSRGKVEWVTKWVFRKSLLDTNVALLMVLTGLFAITNLRDLALVSVFGAGLVFLLNRILDTVERTKV